MAMDLPLIWACIIGFGVFMYVLMDGFDLGVGILFRAAPSERDRDIMMNSVAPIWDGNETWLVLGGAGLLAAFPLAYAVLLPAFYLPLLVMLIALIFRGVAFEFRFKSTRRRFLWDASFNVGSTVATFAQGVVLGTFIQGVEVADRAYAGGSFAWLNPFSLVTGVALIAGYTLLGSCWLIMKTDGALQIWAYEVARLALFVVLGFIVLVSLWTPFVDPSIAARWFSWPNIALLSPVPVLTALLALWLYRALEDGAEVLPFILTMSLFLLCFAGLGISLWPYIIPYEVSIWEAAAQPESLVFVLVGLAFLIPLILAYTAYSYYVFRGKVTAEEGYH
jgi:cytochrome d ubiquinol oxidase subunit II